MTRDEVQRQTECIARLAAQLSNQSRLQAELQRARREFFGPDLQGAGDDAAEHRFAEWFLIERESETLGAVPITIAPYLANAEPLEGSLVGLFLVEATEDLVTAKDMQDNQVIELAERGSLQVGDLLVGRLYPVSGERWAPSAATPALRPGRELAHAFVRDLKGLELDRRLLQIELEHLLLKKHDGKRSGPKQVEVDGGLPDVVEAPQAPLEHLEADLEQLLLGVGCELPATDISQQLAIAAGPGVVMGPLLDQLAFDTKIDIDRTRRLLLEIWNAHHAGQPLSTEQESESKGPPGETLGESLVRKLDRGLGADSDVEELFSEIEKLAGVEPDEADDDDERNTKIVAAVFPTADEDGDAGDLSPLITEFHWETGVSKEDAKQRALTTWVELQRNASVPNTDLESIPAADLMRLLLHMFLRSTPTERASTVHAAYAELRAFYEWVMTTQEIDRRDVLSECKGALLDHLERLQDAGVALSNEQPPAGSPGLMQIEEIGKDGFGARDDDGGSHWLLANETATELLAVGDIVLGGLAAATGDEPTSMHRRLAGLIVVLPIDARSLIV